MASWLRDQGHHVFSVYHEARGLGDDEIMQMALDDDLIVVSNDKDFGELVFRKNKPHKGIVLLRLTDERPFNKIRVLDIILSRFPHRLAGNFVVATETTVRIIYS